MKTNTRLCALAVFSWMCAGLPVTAQTPPSPGQGPGPLQPPGPGVPPNGQPPQVTGQKHPARRPQGRMIATQQMDVNPARLRFGDPLPGLTPSEQRDFALGRVDFTDRETPVSGLGPIFNRDSCVACHGGPAPGGSSPVNVTRFGLLDAGVFDPLEDLGGSLLQERAILPLAREIIPPEANVRARRNSTPLFGLGLIEAIPDSAILAGVRVAPVDGVLGRACIVSEGVDGAAAVGRFGWKAQHASLLIFSGDAYLNEMGITNRLFPVENAPNGDEAKLAQADRVADPEDNTDAATGKADIDKVTDFMRLLAPPPVGTLSASAAAGRTVFNQTNCHLCHTPTMMTGDSPVAALRFKGVNLYSDLLLHDMGPLGDGIVQGDAAGSEMKTPPLWGLRASAPYLHDGRARTVDAAIRAHDGEARSARDRYIQLSAQQRQQLLDFLNSI